MLERQWILQRECGQRQKYKEIHRAPAFADILAPRLALHAAEGLYSIAQVLHIGLEPQAVHAMKGVQHHCMCSSEAGAEFLVSAQHNGPCPSLFTAFC